MNSPNVYGYGTHIIPLALAVEVTTGPVVEFGAGLFSTPFLNYYCVKAESPRKVWSYEENSAWLNRLDHLLIEKDDNHRLIHVPDIMDWVKVVEDVKAIKPSVLLIDNELPQRIQATRYRIRKALAYELLDHCEIMIMHDTESLPYTDDPEWQEFTMKAKLHHTCKRMSPWTDVLSNNPRDWKLQGLF